MGTFFRSLRNSCLENPDSAGRKVWSVAFPDRKDRGRGLPRRIGLLVSKKIEILLTLAVLCFDRYTWERKPYVQYMRHPAGANLPDSVADEWALTERGSRSHGAWGQPGSERPNRFRHRPDLSPAARQIAMLPPCACY
jgi:hypothetical protein